MKCEVPSQGPNIVPSRVSMAKERSGMGPEQCSVPLAREPLVSFESKIQTKLWFRIDASEFACERRAGARAVFANLASASGKSQKTEHSSRMGWDFNAGFRRFGPVNYFL